ncbi:hypothetical protein F3Y22_tig00109978pilonHSYRG00017 [Hibiscus syriacus]|uniref:HMA domain-containing protein n=1 Tax=Hibiscus syriacus TaxID=106335 RepID=A0A6A3BSX9_HIBSY|nr:hypothetical protein F3Y22_tig00109978pilonHSYRG00017 [Hibiscus syriacus]
MDKVASSSCSSASAVQLGGKAIDRHNPIIRDAKRFSRTLPSNPCTSQPPPINPVPYHQLKKNQKKSSSKSSNDHAKKGPSSSSSSSSSSVSANKQIQALKEDQIIFSKQSPPSSPEKPTKDQVVVLRVSLHCKGCEGKVRKHLSRMEGVSSFSIDFPTKKVTIVGDVTPSGVLASVSKVKSAQFWTSIMAAILQTSRAILLSSSFSWKKKTVYLACVHYGTLNVIAESE